MIKLHRTINVINTNIRAKRKKFSVNRSIIDEVTLNFLVNENIISYFFYKENLIFITLSDISLNHNKQVKNLWRGSRNKKVSAQDLTSNRAYKSKSYVLSTSKGIITSLEAKQQNVGGILRIGLN